MNNGKVCIAISAVTASEMLDAAHRAEAAADIIELRFDSLAPDEVRLAEVMVREASITRPVILTYRSPEQGGLRDLTREQRLKFWHEADLNEWARDLEEDVIESARKGTTILSFHDFAGSADIATVIERLANCGADILKVAVAADDVTDALPVWSTLTATLPDGVQKIPIAMGEAGKWTRILGPAHGAFVTYASLDAGSETAGGQITAGDLLNVYRVKELDRDTRVYGVIGDPVSSSLSPYMHNAAFHDAGLNAVFIPLQVRDLDAFMRRMVRKETREVELNFAGFAVTMPHKQTVMRYLDGTDASAETIGAVNTVKIESGKLTGYNTDAVGFLSPLKERMPDLRGSRVAVLGAGGAARAVVHALKREGADITVFARDIDKAQSWAERFAIPVEPLFAIDPSLFTLVVNATPLGMLGQNSGKTPISAEQLEGVRFVYDLVTRPDDTPLLREALKAGVPAIGGIEMLIAQGVEQFSIWTGLNAPSDLMRRAVLDRLVVEA